MIDSNDRTADSASTSDFTVNLPSQLLIDDDHGIQKQITLETMIGFTLALTMAQPPFITL